MNNIYTLTVSESSTGRFSVTSVEKKVRVNQHRTDLKPLANDTFAFAAESNPQSMVMPKKAMRKTR
jgi:hypothetical protein